MEVFDVKKNPKKTKNKTKKLNVKKFDEHSNEMTQMFFSPIFNKLCTELTEICERCLASCTRNLKIISGGLVLFFVQAV